MDWLFGNNKPYPFGYYYSPRTSGYPPTYGCPGSIGSKYYVHQPSRMTFCPHHQMENKIKTCVNNNYSLDTYDTQGNMKPYMADGFEYAPTII